MYKRTQNARMQGILRSADRFINNCEKFFLLAKKIFRGINRDMNVCRKTIYRILGLQTGKYAALAKRCLPPLPYSTQKSKTTGYTTAELVDMIHKWVV